MSSDPSAAQLRQYVERIERLLEERHAISADIRDVYAEARAVGFDTRTIRALVTRRAMPPEHRQEADALLETYESALSRPTASLHEDGDDIALPDSRPDIAAIALAMLEEQVAAMEDPEQAALLTEHVVFLLDLRAEIAELRRQESERKKLAHGEGFDAKQIGVTVRWFEKVAKHGLKVMRAAEATFHLYRSTVESAGASSSGAAGPISDDPKLGAMFAPEKAKPGKASRMMARLRADAEATRRALSEDARESGNRFPGSASDHKNQGGL